MIRRSWLNRLKILGLGLVMSLWMAAGQGDVMQNRTAPQAQNGTRMADSAHAFEISVKSNVLSVGLARLMTVSKSPGERGGQDIAIAHETQWAKIVLSFRDGIFSQSLPERINRVVSRTQNTEGTLTWNQVLMIPGCLSGVFGSLAVPAFFRLQKQRRNPRAPWPPRFNLSYFLGACAIVNLFFAIVGHYWPMWIAVAVAVCFPLTLFAKNLPKFFQPTFFNSRVLIKGIFLQLFGAMFWIGLFGTVGYMPYAAPIAWTITFLLAVLVTAFNATNWHCFFRIYSGSTVDYGVVGDIDDV